MHRQEVGRRARIYGLALCFLMLVFFSAVKLARYHSGERSFTANKVWQQDTSDKQAVQIELQGQTAIPFLAVMALIFAPVLAVQWIPVRVATATAMQTHWFNPPLFLRPPPAIQ